MNFTLTRAQLEAKRAELSTQGVQLVGDSGEFTAHGVTVGYTYNEPTLNVEVKDHGAYPGFFVNHAIKGWFKA